MKRLLPLLFSLLTLAAFSQQPYLPSTDGQSITRPVGANGFPTEARSQFHDRANFLWRDYRDSTEIITTLTSVTNRKGHALLFVHSGGTLLSTGLYSGGVTQIWWFKDGTSNSDLVQFNAGSVDPGTSVPTPVAINYGYKTTDPFIDISTAPTYTSLGTTNTAYSSDINIVFPNVAADNYLVIRSPSTEPIKTNGGFLPDQVWRVVLAGSYTYYISRNQYALNGAVKLF